MPATAIRPASPAQVRFINSLRSQRALSALSTAEATALDVRSASFEIDRLRALPVVRANAAPAGQRPAGARMLEGIPFSKYALREDGVLTFWEVKEFKGTAYLRLLIGAPGEFRKVRVEYDRARRVVEAIRESPAAAALAFARHYTCCAVCGADLSDPTSVELGLGPICRGRFGL